MDTAATPSSSYSSSSSTGTGDSSTSSSSAPSLRQLFKAEGDMSARGVAQVRFGSSSTHSILDSLQLVTAEKPHASNGQIVVRMTVRPINPSDLNTIRNSRFSRLAAQGRRIIIGDEGCGVVEEVGEGVTKFVKGQRVVPLGMLTYFKDGQGTWQDYIVVDEVNAFPVPPSVSDEVAAQFIVNPWAALGLLERLDVPKGEYLLQTAAGSSMGRLIIQLAKHFGIKTINIVRRDEWRKELKSLGADEVINCKTEDVRSRVKEITAQKMAYAAVDAVAGMSTKVVAACVRDGGMVIVYGALSSNDITYSIYDLRRKVQLDWFYLGDYVPTREKIDLVASKVMRLLELKVMRPYIGRKYPLADFRDAIAESEREGRGGKVLLVS
ncbi:hypothetical protein KP509_11G056100 [Ceratopteris richardii]|uniref:Enoyl reductase (ER) domain-containing protein n=2 Tax=Ceratopteris richardii TaxID=49495 RepID=A0A8T2TRR7_CERRI|nr:hypothetical protein KP509_11G056100 [Ceratopteris richardii]